VNGAIPRWSIAVRTLTEPYRVTLPMILLVSMVPNDRSEIPERDRLAAPVLALIVVGIVALVFTCYVVAYASDAQAART
jgi:hypothetical protein